MKNKKLFISSTFAATFLCVPYVAYSSWILGKSTSKNLSTKDSDNPDAKPVAYISSNENVKYTSIEKALDIAKSNDSADTIYVIPGTNPTIERNCEVAKGDTLIFPYEETTREDPGRNSVQNDLFADGNLVNINKNRKNLVKVKNGVTITNNGSIKIGGILGSSVSWSRQRPTGHTTGSYVELRMADNSTISNFGEITCYGYIKPEKYYTIENTNQPLIYNHSTSSMNLPLVIYDYRGARFSLAAAQINKTMPFNIFDFPNSQTKMIFENYSKLGTTVTLVSNGDSVQQAEMNLIDSENAIFKIIDGDIAIKYLPSKNNFANNEFFTTNDSATTTSLDNINKTQVLIDGNFEFSSTQLNLSSLPIDTSQFNLPFSYKYDIIILSNTTNINSKLKFLKGSKLTVSENAILNINNETAFYTNYTDEATTAQKLYPHNVQKSELINNGTININANFSGFVTSSKSESVLNISSTAALNTSVQELLTGEKGSGWFGSLKIAYTFTYVNGVAHGNISSNEDYSNPVLCQFLNGNQYISNENGIWFGEPGDTNITESKSPVQAGEDDYCLSKNTDIITKTSIKSIKNITKNDSVLTYNHFTGKFEFKEVILKVSHFEGKVKNINLHFENNYNINIINGHGLFCLEERKYISINSTNALQYLGKRFAISENQNIKYVKLCSVSVTESVEESFALITDSNYNVIANNLLTVTDITSGLFNLFPYEKNTCNYDNKFLNNFIKNNGYLKYETFKNVITEKTFNYFNVRYLKYKYIKKEFSIPLVKEYLNILEKYYQLKEVEFCKFFD